MTDLQARAEAAADAVAHRCKGSLIWKTARDGALHALQSEGWRDISEAPEAGEVLGYLRSTGRRAIVKLRDGKPFVVGSQFAFDTAPVTHFQLLPTPPEGEGA